MTPGGLWDSGTYEIKVLVKYEGKIVETVGLDYAGPSTFAGQAVVEKKGAYELIVYAFDPRTGNSGVDRTRVTVK
ncbi:MAG: hypothetical protein JSU90_01405 [Nitrospiraceae bacterium]|nr:MAG: hypothetical protein JSU90_01405 [Nitrospiraceae bacterium]